MRRWLVEQLSHARGGDAADRRECQALADRLLAAVDDRSRVVLEVMGRRYDEGELDRVAGWLDRVVAGEPVQHVVGWTEFRGLRIACGPEALIPRPETEELVGWFLEGMAERVVTVGRDGPIRVVDLGTGSGCIALAVKSARPDWEVWGVDRSEAALNLARRNGEALGLQVHWAQWDMLEPALPDGPQCWDGMVSNPPYIPHSEAATLSAHVREREPHEALFVPDSAPLLFYIALRRWAESQLAPGGCLAAECHVEFTQDVAECWQLEGAETEVLCDLQGAERAVRLVRHNT